MRVQFDSAPSPGLACLLLLVGMVSAQTTTGPNSAGTTAAPSSAAAPPLPDAHLPPVTAKLNGLAHRLVQAGVKSNALADERLAPWHIKIDYQMHYGANPKPVSGSVEEWHGGPQQWRRTYTSALPELTGAEWSTSQGEQFIAKRGMNHSTYHFLLLRVTRPVLDPLYQAANIKPDYEMKAIRTTTEGVTLNCASVVDGARYTEDPDYIFATSCFDQDMHLRLTVAGNTSVQFDDVQMFLGRAVARDVKVIQQGNLLAEMKVSLLEPLAPGTEATMKPPADAVAEPYTIEAGFPRPESVYEVAAALPLAPNGKPFSGVGVVPILIHKDGTVKVYRSDIATYPALADALEAAINKWKYKPYVVDGQPVEVSYGVAYRIDGKPFVPSYERPKPKPVESAPEDFSSTYDPKRDPVKDLATAEAQAASAHKRILVEVGGTWCSWCKILDKFFDGHTDLRDLRDSSFVLLKINMSANNENAAFLAQYPAIPGYPWLFVLDEKGKLLVSQNTDPLENGAGYSPKAVKDFLAAWRPQGGLQ
ncbi:MAG TPA: thioredoxin family protein [Terracidiphilus sp.]|jgi:hypothetical protein